ncbi:hypothetical protein RHMOL_Rhmol13G0174900 [Rhododendron molle]|uniref:Uncharacterized protein n=1 Tax=Rhododendron molle TaxID=49168 RepID=A0ACC0L8X0_RHOML|nr:hypothetical protein RHMOL_Rhmol13G0174900 [Rhododendron molle]
MVWGWRRMVAEVGEGRDGDRTAELMEGWATEGWWGWRGGHGEGLGMEGSGCSGQWRRRRPDGGEGGRTAEMMVVDLRGGD